MPTLDSIIGISGGSPGVGGPLMVLATANANLTIPGGGRLVFVSVRSNSAILTVTLPTIVGVGACAIVLSCPDGAANTVTVTAAAGNTVLGGATASITGDNLVVLVAVPGSTNWEGHVGT